MSGEGVIDAGRKLIRTGSYQLETMDYPKTIQEIEALVNRVGGYIQGSSATGESAVRQGYQSARSAYMTLRVPAEQFFEVGKALSSIAAVVSSQHNAEEVTDYYYDTEARLATLQVQEERLLVLMSQATELEAVILLEQRLSEVRYEIESHQGTLRRLDSQISFSTLDVYIQEVFEPTVYEEVPVTLGQRIASRFRATLAAIKRGAGNLVVVVLGDGLRWLINLAILAAVGYGIYRAWRFVKARRGQSPARPRHRGKRRGKGSAAAPPAEPKPEDKGEAKPPVEAEPEAKGETED